MSSAGPPRPVRRAVGNRSCRSVAVAAAVAACFAAAIAPACTYPDFQFGDGDTGAGGAGGGAASSSTGGEGPRVPCSDPPVLCNEGDICCFHTQQISLDHCGKTGQCGPDFIELRCNGPSDCPATAPVCCAKDDELDNEIEIIACQPTCNAVTERTLCEVPADCDNGMCGPLFQLDYEGYQGCAKP